MVWMKVKQLLLFLSFLILLLSFIFSCIVSQADGVQERFSFERVLGKQVPAYYRGKNFETWTYPNRTVVWSSATQFVWNGKAWVPYVYDRDLVKKCYRVQMGLISGEIYDSGVAVFYDVNMTEQRVKSETWELWNAIGDKKATLNTPITFSVVQNSTGVYINATRTTSKPSGVLTIIYCFRVGSPLKHYVVWKSTAVSSQTVKIKQVWDLADFITKYQIDGTEKTVSGDYSGSRFLFYSETNAFIVFEDQTAMFDKLEPTSIDFAGKKVIYTFSDWTLSKGGSLVIDPATSTFNDPTEDGYIDDTYTRTNTSTSITFYNVAGSVRRGYVEWDISSIPDDATIDDVDFNYHGYVAVNSQHEGQIYPMELRPSVSGNEDVWNDIANGTKYYGANGFPEIGTGKTVDLGSSADSDVQSHLALDWFAIGLKGEDEVTQGRTKRFYSEDFASANPKPTLQVTYIPANTAPINDDLTLDLMGASYKGTKTLLAGKQDYKFVLKCTDINGVTDITYAEIRLDYATKNLILRATRSSGDAWTFSEQSDPSNYVTLNVVGSSHSTSGNQKTFNFLVTINWNWDDASETLGVRAYVIDSVSASDQDDYTNIFGVENDLSASSLSVNDYHCNPAQTLTFSGYWCYEDTSIPPPDGDYQVKIKLAGVQKGSIDTTLLNGTFSISDVTAEAVVNSYSYTAEATYMVGAGSFSPVIVEGLKVSAYSIDLTNVKVYVRLLYAYDNSAVANGNVSLAGLYALTNSTGWATFDMGSVSDFDYGQLAYGLQDSAYGITYKNTNQTIPIAKKTRLIESDATISALTWDGTKLTLAFSGASGSYTLKVSGSRPTFLLNTTYNLANNYTTYLSLTHDADRKIVISYAAWGDFYVRSLDHILQDIYWTDQKLTLILNGTTGETGTLTLYAGDRANPESTSGFTITSYNANTKVFTGNYQFSSLITLILDWTKPSGTPSGPSIHFQAGHLNMDAAIGTRTPFTLNIEFNVHRITIARVEFGQNPEWFKITDALPKDFSGTGPTTYAKINGEAIIPSTASDGTLTIPITVYGKGPEGQQLQTSATMTLTITQQPAGPNIPEIITRMLGDPLILILLIATVTWLGYYELKRH